MKLKPTDTVTYIEDIMWCLRHLKSWEESDWYRLQEHTSPKYRYIKTQAARSQVILELYK